MAEQQPTTSSALNDPDKLSYLDRPFNRRPKVDLPIISIHFLYASIISYCLGKATTGTNLESRQQEMGARMGVRVLLLVSHREKVVKRETRILPILTFLSQPCWKFMFGRSGDLFQSSENPSEYMLTDKKFLLTKYCNLPKGEGFVNCAAFGAGIIEGILGAAEFPCVVTAHLTSSEQQGKGVVSSSSVTFLISFLSEVLQREKEMSG